MGTSKPKDFVWSGLVHLGLVSTRVRDGLELAGATGVSFFDVTLQRLTGAEISGYSGLCVTGRAGRAGWRPEWVTQSGVDHVVTGIAVNDDSFDGSDVCVFDDLFGVFVSSRVAELLLAMRVTGLRLTSTRAYQRRFLPGELQDRGMENL